MKSKMIVNIWNYSWSSSWEIIFRLVFKNGPSEDFFLLLSIVQDIILFWYLLLGTFVILYCFLCPYLLKFGFTLLSGFVYKISSFFPFNICFICHQLDRFIPNRSAMDFDLARYMLVEGACNGPWWRVSSYASWLIFLGVVCLMYVLWSCFCLQRYCLDCFNCDDGIHILKRSFKDFDICFALISSYMSI
jgi:hypothetical protein